MAITLETPLADALHLLGKHLPALKKLGLHTVRDLLYHLPVRYGGTSPTRSVSTLAAGDTVVLHGTIGKIEAKKGWVKKIPMASGTLSDGTGTIGLVWFNQPYLAKMIGEGALVRVEGKISARKKTGALYLSNPKIEKVDALPDGGGDSLFPYGAAPSALSPVYPETRGLSSNWLYHAVQKVFAQGVLDTVTDPLPDDVRERYHLPAFKTAMVWAHAPQKESDAQAARKRFAFEEVFFIQLLKQQARRTYAAEPTFAIDDGWKRAAPFIERFPFPLTTAQERALQTVFDDFARGAPMQRLLEGDVGSGKTAVAATLAYATVTTRPKGQSFGTLQCAYMAPTEILATQHFESFVKYFKHLPIKIALLTGSSCRVFPSKVAASVKTGGWTDISRPQLLKWVASGEIAILLGTHSLIQKSVKFKHLALAVIDEQHRFGTRQRQKLVRRVAGGEQAPAPHLLSMTATPIPRTLALTVYGDLDLSVLDALPAGRKPVITEVVAVDGRRSVYEKIRAELKSGRQAYVICPRIDEPDPAKEAALMATSAKEEAKRLAKEVFPEFPIGLLHGKMKPEEKDRAMAAFMKGETRVLVATSVVEVGVNVENATSIIIEGAERFGLAQLHQLRGRVQRSSFQPYCYIFSGTQADEPMRRLRTFAAARDGFALAEEDLKRRGPGELLGDRQWGVSDVAMDALKNLRLVEAARTEASAILDADQTLAKHASLAAELTRRGADEVHFE